MWSNSPLENHRSGVKNHKTATLPVHQQQQYPSYLCGRLSIDPPIVINDLRTRVKNGTIGHISYYVQSKSWIQQHLLVLFNKIILVHFFKLMNSYWFLLVIWVMSFWQIWRLLINVSLCYDFGWLLLQLRFFLTGYSNGSYTRRN